jgi:hypothetical protein
VNKAVMYAFPSAYRVLLANPIAPNETNIWEMNRAIRASDFFQRTNAPNPRSLKSVPLRSRHCRERKNQPKDRVPQGH